MGCYYEFLNSWWAVLLVLYCYGVGFIIGKAAK